MPELPEVQTTVNGLKKTVIGLTIRDVWSDLPVRNHPVKHYRETIKNLSFFEKFKKEVVGKKIIGAERRAKNILIQLSNKKTILIHLKMTGHLMFGEYAKQRIKNHDSRFKNKTKEKFVWVPSDNEKNLALRDPYNKFLHVVFTLSNSKHLVFSDARKFGTITLIDSARLYAPGSMLYALGPEPLENNFTLSVFTDRLLKKPNGKIKQVLMDQSVIAGIGNIYSDEMLWLASIHPEERVKNISIVDFKKLYTAMKTVLKKGIDFGGDSTSDYRNIFGERGAFSAEHNAYQKTGKRCGKTGCKGVILRKIVGGRSAHFCSAHQKLSK